MSTTYEIQPSKSGFHDLIDPRETRPVLCDWIARARPLLERLKGPTSFPMRP